VVVRAARFMAVDISCGQGQDAAPRSGPICAARTRWASDRSVVSDSNRHRALLVAHADLMCNRPISVHRRLFPSGVRSPAVRRRECDALSRERSYSWVWSPPANSWNLKHWPVRSWQDFEGRPGPIVRRLTPHSAPSLRHYLLAATGSLRWLRLFGQFFRFDKWNLYRG
jgi:hypothetical protein